MCINIWYKINVYHDQSFEARNSYSEEKIEKKLVFYTSNSGGNSILLVLQTRNINLRNINLAEKRVLQGPSLIQFSLVQFFNFPLLIPLILKFASNPFLYKLQMQKHL